MSRYENVDDQKAAGFPVTAACAAAGVSTSGFYDWRTRRLSGPTPRQVADEEVRDLAILHTDRATGVCLRGHCGIKRPSVAGLESPKGCGLLGFGGRQGERTDYKCG